MKCGDLHRNSCLSPPIHVADGVRSVQKSHLFPVGMEGLEI